MYKAIARMFDGNKEWNVTIYSQYDTFQDAKRGAMKYVQDFDNNPKCPWLSVLWVQVLPT